MKTKTNKIDMTKGPIIKLSLLFAIPIIIGNILQQLYNTVDTAVISNFCDDSSSIAAVGTSAHPVELFLCIFLGLGTGVSILVAQAVGNKDDEKLKETVSTSCTFLYLCAVPVTILGFIFTPLVLTIMQAPDTISEVTGTSVKALATDYTRIIFLSTLGNLGYNMNAGILRGLGDTKASLLFLFISCIINVVLDILLVAVIPLGVQGAAIATGIAMFASWFFSIYYIKKNYSYIGYTILPRKMNKTILGEIVKIGLPLGLNNSIYSLGHIMMQSLTNTQGEDFIAACSVASKLTGIANVAITSLSSAATTFSGQNYGAKKYSRLKKGGWLIPVFSGAITLTGGLLCVAFGKPLLSIFTEPVETNMVYFYALRYVNVMLPCTWLYAVFNGIICFANGLGEVKYPTIINILMLWAVRIPVGYAIAIFFDGTWLMLCFPISFAFGMICMFAFFLTKRWKEICRLAKEEKEQAKAYSHS